MPSSREQTAHTGTGDKAPISTEKGKQYLIGNMTGKKGCSRENVGKFTEQRKSIICSGKLQHSEARGNKRRVWGGDLPGSLVVKTTLLLQEVQVQNSLSGN